MLATSLTLGCLCGLELIDGTPWQALGYGLLELAFLLWMRARQSGVPWMLLALFLGALVHAAAAAHGLESSAALGSTPAPLLRGTWRNLGAGPRGFVVPQSGEAQEHSILVPAAGRVAEGSQVSVRPGTGSIPWPAGPRPGPMGAQDRFAGLLPMQPDELIVHAQPRDLGLSSWAAGMGGSIQSKADELEPEGLAHGLLRALLLGDRSRVAPACLDLFTRTGARHALALSGLHVGLLAGLLLLPLSALVRCLPRRLFGGLGWRAHARRETLLLGIRLGCLLLFLLLVGAGPPVVRAVCALSMSLLGPRLPSAIPGGYQPGRRPDGLSIWAAALSLELACNPLAVQQLSLRLSYVATLGILLGTTPLMRALGLRKDLFDYSFRRATLGLWIAIPLERLLKALACGVCASIAAVAASLPDIASQFGEFSPTGVLFAPLVLALLGLLLLAAWLSVLLQADLWAGELAQALVALLQWVDRLPGTPVPLPPRPALLLWLLGVLFFAALQAATPLWSRRFKRMAACLAGVLLLPWQASAEGLELHLFDVGHGTCALLRAPGMPALVFDAGSLQRTGIYREALAPLLAHWEVNRPWVVLSHDDRDHHSGLPKLIERYAPALWIGALPEQLGERLAHDTGRIDLAMGMQQMLVGPAEGPLELHLVRGSSQAGNEGSRSLLVSWRGQRMLLSGDAEAEGLGHMLDQKWLRGPLRLLLFPHHGSETRHMSELLSQTAPEEIWISASQERPAVAPELDRRAIKWRSTGATGPLALGLR